MRKAGRRVTDSMWKQVVAERDFLIAEPDPVAIIRAGLVFHPGERVERVHPVTGKVERWVLLRPVGPPADFHSNQHHADWMRGAERFMRKQRWEAAFVTSVRP